jgi:hypothetical protein
MFREVWPEDFPTSCTSKLKGVRTGAAVWACMFVVKYGGLRSLSVRVESPWMPARENGEQGTGNEEEKEVKECSSDGAPA